MLNASDLNAEFDSIIDNADDLVSPRSKALDLDGNELILDANGNTSITADTDDQIDVRIAGGDDFRFTANKFLVLSGSNLDMNGQELILDANANTSLTADTDDQIDVKIGGTDEWHFTNGFYAEGESDQGDGTIAIPADSLYFGGTQFGLGIANNFTTDQTISSTATDANPGPTLTLDRNSASPAASDQLGELVFRGRDSGGANADYAQIGATITDATNASEDATLDFTTFVAGTAADRWHIGNGLYGNGATGGDQGADTINLTADGLYFDGTQFGLGVANVFTASQTIDTSGGAAVLNILSDQSSGSAAFLDFEGHDSGANDTTYVRLDAGIDDATDASEDGHLSIQTVLAGTLADRWHIGNGIYADGQSDQGADTIAIGSDGLYFGGTQFGLGIGNTWTAGQIIDDGSTGASQPLTVRNARKTVGQASGLNLAAHDAADNDTVYGRLEVNILDATNGSEDSRIDLDTMVGGTLGNAMFLAQGLFMPGTTGGDPGAGKINAVEVQDDGVALCHPTHEAVGLPTSREEWHALAPTGHNRLLDRHDAMVAKGWDNTAAGYVALMEADGAAPGLDTKAEIEAATVTWTDDNGVQFMAKGKISMTERLEHLWLAQDYSAIAIRDIEKRLKAAGI